MKDNQSLEVTPQTHGLALDLNLDDALSMLKQGLTANTLRWNGLTKKMEEQPDWKTRLHSIELHLAYKIGKPVERRELLVNHNYNLEDMMKRAKSTPSTKRALRRLLAELESETGGAPTIESGPADEK